jgi:hypothetical protein
MLNACDCKKNYFDELFDPFSPPPQKCDCHMKPKILWFIFCFHNCIDSCWRCFDRSQWWMCQQIASQERLVYLLSLSIFYCWWVNFRGVTESTGLVLGEGGSGIARMIIWGGDICQIYAPLISMLIRSVYFCSCWGTQTLSRHIETEIEKRYGVTSVVCSTLSTW